MANVAAHGEGAPVDWEPVGHYVGKHDEVGVFVVRASVVEEEVHGDGMDDNPLPWSM